MITADPPETSPAGSAHPIIITSLEHNVWQELERKVANALERLQCPRLLDSILLLLHKLITNMVTTMHRHAFQQAIESDLNIDITSKNGAFDTLLQNELAAHGDRNIEQFCKQHHYRTMLTFPEEKGTLIQIDYPASCGSSIYLDYKLARAIGFMLTKQAGNGNPDEHHRARIVWDIEEYHSHQAQTGHSQLLSRTDESEKANTLFCNLNYGIMIFSSAGDILSTSPAISAI